MVPETELFNEPEALVEVGLIYNFSEHAEPNLRNTVADVGCSTNQNINALQRENASHRQYCWARTFRRRPWVKAARIDAIRNHADLTTAD